MNKILIFLLLLLTSCTYQCLISTEIKYKIIAVKESSDKEGRYCYDLENRRYKAEIFIFSNKKYNINDSIRINVR